MLKYATKHGTQIMSGYSDVKFLFKCKIKAFQMSYTLNMPFKNRLFYFNHPGTSSDGSFLTEGTKMCSSCSLHQFKIPASINKSLYLMWCASRCLAEVRCCLPADCSPLHRADPDSEKAPENQTERFPLKHRCTGGSKLVVVIFKSILNIKVKCSYLQTECSVW